MVVRGSLEPDQLVGALRPEADDGARRQLPLDVALAQPACARQLDEKLRRERRRLRGEIRIDALLPAIRALGPQLEPLRAPQQPERLEVGRLEQDLGRRVPHLGLLAAHDPGERDRALRVGDHEVALVELAVDAVERPELLAALCATHDDPVARERAAVEGVQRVAQRQHDVVRDVDDVGDGAHAGAREAGTKPRRRGPDPDVGERTADVAWTALEVLDTDVDSLGPARLRVDARRRRQVDVEERRDLARDAVDAEQVDPVARRLDVQDQIGKRQHVGERRPRLALR